MGTIILDLDRAHYELRKAIILALPMPGVWGIKIGNLVLRQGMDDVLQNIGGVNIFVDLKHTDVHDRMQSIVKLYQDMGRYAPKYLSVSGDVNLKTLTSIRTPLNGITVVMVPMRSDQDDEECKREYGYADFEWLMRRLAKAESAGISAVTCPARLLPTLAAVRARKAFRTVIATGIRSKSVGKNEHINPMPPEDALKLGATHVVIGREVLEAPDPVAMLRYLAARCGGDTRPGRLVDKKV